ncbi:MAG: FtsX-like permease family protein [Gemmatimonadetes bacterium]|nr:FtsX-like permease family protein [Gemmatimonadota bacterium]
MSAAPRPPRMVGWILDLLDPTGEARADLDEEYLAYRLGEKGALRAGAWYASQVVRSAPHLWRRRRTSLSESLLGELFVDVASAARMVRRRPGPALLVVVTLAIALGINTSVFSLTWSVVMRPLPFSHQDRLVRIYPDELFYIDLAGAQRVQEESPSVEEVLPWGRTLFTLTATNPAEELRGAVVRHGHFTALGTRPLLGRDFNRGDALTQPTDAVIISHAVWTRVFGADPSAVGQRLEIGGRTRTLVGVTGPEHVPMEPDWEAWAPLPLDAASAGYPLALNALLRPGASAASVEVEIRRALEAAWIEGGATVSEEDLAAVRVVPLRGHLLGDVRTPLLVLLSAVVFVLLLACANVATLLLAQGSVRRGEVAIRASLGAGRGRILRQLTFEMLILAGSAAVVGLVFATSLRSWASSRLPATLPRADQWDVGGIAVAFTMVATLLAVLAGGVLPGWRTARGGDSAQLLRGAGRRSAGRLSTALVGLQVALSVLLVVGAGLMTRSFVALSSVDPGFRPDGAVAVRLTPPSGRYEGESVTLLYDEIRRAAVSSPEIESAGGILFLPMTPGGAWVSFHPETDVAPDGNLPSTALRIVTPGYFEAMGIDLATGRYLDDGDGADAEPVAVINRTLARHAFSSPDPVGRMLVMGGDGQNTVRVVGVVDDVRQSDLRTEVYPEVYRPLGQQPITRLYMVARSSGDDDAALAALYEAVGRVDEDVLLSRSGHVRDIVRRSMGTTRLVTQLLGLFGVLALTLGAIGIYGVSAHNVAVRRREMGIRMALGADSGGVARETLLSGLVPVAVGIAAGLIAAAGASGTLQSLLYAIPPRDTVTFLLVPAFFTLVAVASLAVPMIRAGQTDPVETLRSD